MVSLQSIREPPWDESRSIAKRVEALVLFSATEQDLVRSVRRCLVGERVQHLQQIFRFLLKLLHEPVSQDNVSQADGDNLQSRLRLQWRALILSEHLFLHVKGFRTLALSHIHKFLQVTLLGHELIRNRSLIAIGRFIDRCRLNNENKLVEFLPRYIKTQYKLSLGKDPRVLRKEQLSIDLLNISEEFRSKTDYASDLLYELDQCIKILVPDPNTFAECCFMLDGAVSGVVDDFESNSESDSFSSSSELDDEYLQWSSNRNYNNERYGSYSMELKLHRSMAQQESDDNRPLFDIIRGCYRVLLKTISPELHHWRDILERARKAAKTEQSKLMFWNRATQIRYGIVASLCLRVEEATWRCEILLGLQDVSPDISQSTHTNDQSKIESESQPIPKKKTRETTARTRIARKLKRKR